MVLWKKTFSDHVELLFVMMEEDVNSVRKHSISLSKTQLVCLKINVCVNKM